MDWFVDIFMKSLIEKMGTRSDMYISEKQANVCARYMQPRDIMEGYYIVIGDYQYTMRYMKKGYGKLSRLAKNVAIK